MEHGPVCSTILSLILGTHPYLEDVAALAEDQVAYGSFSGAGSLIVNRTANATASKYSRWLDMDRAVVVSRWKEGGVWISRYANSHNGS